MRSLNTIKGKLLLAFISLTLIIVFLSGFTFFYMKKGQRIREEKEVLYAFYNKTLELFKHDSEIIRFDFQKVNYSKSNPDNLPILKREKIVSSINEGIFKLEQNEGVENSFEESQLQSLKSLLQLYNEKINLLVNHALERGYGNIILSENINSYANQLENNPENLELADILLLRKFEKDYLLTAEDEHIKNFNAKTDYHITQITSRKKKNSLHTIELLTGYKESLNKLAALNSFVGTNKQEGIRTEIIQNQDSIQNAFVSLIQQTQTKHNLLEKDEKLIFGISVLYGILLSIFLSLFTASKISRPLRKLSRIMDNTENFKVDKSKISKLDNSTVEVKILVSSFEKLLDEISRQLDLINEKSEALKEQNLKLQYSEANLNESNKVKDKFFSILAHDLRGPFATIKSFLEILVNHADGFTKEEIQRLSKEMLLTVESLSVLLENLLEWSRTQMGKVKYTPTLLNISEITEKNVQIIRVKAFDKNISIENNIKEEVFAYADANMIDFILRNLLSNAVKFTHQNGKITISCKIVIDVIEIYIKDNGIGLSKEDQLKLFKKDYQFSRMGTSSEKGTGLGLLLCKEFIEKNSGKILIESTIGEGATFIFTLPIYKHQEEMAL